MKSFTKVIAIISAVFILSGAVCAAAGVFLGADMAIAFSEAREGLRESANIHQDITGEVDSLDISCGGCHVKIRQGDEFFAEGDENTNLTWEVREGVLHINAKAKAKLINFNPGGVVICVPKDFVAKNASVSVAAGSLNMMNIEASELKISVGAGEAKIADVKADNTAIEVGMGDLKASGDFGNTELRVGMGSAQLDAWGDYTMQYRCGAGDIKADGKSIASGAGSGTYGSGARSMKAEVGMGDAKINFEKGNEL